MAEVKTYDKKEYLDYDGLVEVFKLIKGKYVDQEDVDSLSDDDIDDAYCESIGGCDEPEPEP